MQNFSELESEFVEKCREQICYSGECDPVETAYEVIRGNSNYPEVFTIFGNYLATEVNVDIGTLFETMHEENLDWSDLDEYTRFLLQEAGYNETGWNEYKEEMESYKEID